LNVLYFVINKDIEFEIHLTSVHFWKYRN